MAWLCLTQQRDFVNREREINNIKIVFISFNTQTVFSEWWSGAHANEIVTRSTLINHALVINMKNKNISTLQINNNNDNNNKLYNKISFSILKINFRYLPEQRGYSIDEYEFSARGIWYRD